MTDGLNSMIQEIKNGKNANYGLDFGKLLKILTF
jgi:hypothetical protein